MKYKEFKQELANILADTEIEDVLNSMEESEFSIRLTKYNTYFASAIINGVKCGQCFTHKPSILEAIKALMVNYRY